jgi:hypothetical protein
MDPLDLPARGENAILDHAPWRQRLVIEPLRVDTVRRAIQSHRIARVDTQQGIDSLEARELAYALLDAADEVERRDDRVLPAAEALLTALNDDEEER